MRRFEAITHVRGSFMSSLHTKEAEIGLTSVYIRLERLLLSANKIQRIEPTSNSETSPVRNLKHLALSSNGLADWADLDGLVQWCPNLESLKLTGNPLVEGNDPHFFSLRSKLLWWRARFSYTYSRSDITPPINRNDQMPNPERTHDS